MTILVSLTKIKILSGIINLLSLVEMLPGTLHNWNNDKLRQYRTRWPMQYYTFTINEFKWINTWFSFYLTYGVVEVPYSFHEKIYASFNLIIDSLKEFLKDLSSKCTLEALSMYSPKVFK